ncbi:MAG TPA: hypothetical protein VGJ45_21475 [Pseudonocardiaceae bacterium]
MTRARWPSGARTDWGIAHLRNMANVADPSVARRDGGYWMVLGTWKPTALVAGGELVVFRTAMGLPSASPAPLFGIGRVAVPLEGLT